MLYIGNHTSSSAGYLAMGKRTAKKDGNTFAFFTRNPRGGRAKAIQEEDVEKFLKLAKEEISPVKDSNHKLRPFVFYFCDVIF